MADEFYTAEELLALPYGSTVRVVVAYAQFEKGDIIYKSKSNMPHLNDLRSCYFTKEYEDPTGEGTSGGDWMTYEEVAKMLPEMPEDLGVYRPELATRKVGKVPVHMVVDGFPLAFKEIAKVMGWAADAKGYKLHDWRNLPQAEVALPSANYRHMLENSQQKSEGVPALERVDHESSLLHLAHQAFNVLAELELVLGGKIE